MAKVHPKYKVACVQAAPVYFDLDATVDKAVKLIEDAAKNGAKLIAFPETWIPGYPYFAWLGAPAWALQFIPAYHDNSFEIGSAQDKKLHKAARDNNIYVFLGYSEKSGGSLYMGQMLIGSDGNPVYSRRKLKPTHVERTIFGEGDGSHIAVHELEIGRVGGLCCWEHLQPLTKYAMYSMNEQVHVAAWPGFSLYSDMAYALGPQANTAASQVYALEGQCFVLASSQVADQNLVDMLCDTPERKAMLKVGGGYSMIFAPDGSPMCQPIPPDQDGILYADIDLGMISLAKAAADPAGHYSRPDVTRLQLNTSPAQRVVPLNPSFVGDTATENGVHPVENTVELVKSEN
jgi:nitrilase